MFSNSQSIGRRDFLRAALLGSAALVLPDVRGVEGPASGKVTKKFVIGHRGACAYAPENTLPSYQLAIKQGVDYVEQDLQITKDGVLVCSHDAFLERVTDAAEIFPDRFKEETVRAKPVRHWYIRDFTLKEIKQLDAGGKFASEFKGTTIPTWQEAIDAIRGKAGLCPETKIPAVYAKSGFNMEDLVGEALRKNNLAKADPSTPVLFQSFSQPSLKKLAGLGFNYPRLKLAAAGARWSSALLEETKQYATGISPAKNDVTAELVKQAHAAGLQVVPYTYSSSTVQSPDKEKRYQGVHDEIIHALNDLGVDGLFTDNPDQFPHRRGR
jgi:glycerophosphoryl diester phosphodiesterase